MNAFQTLTSLVLLIFVLSVIVQAIQEIIKAILGTKANVMEKTITQFMGDHLTVPQVRKALEVRGLDLTALEHLNKQDFRLLLDGITLEDPQLKGVVASAQATVAQVKDNIAASYEAARAVFARTYMQRNKLFVIIISLVVVILLNANLIILYEQIAADQATQQAIIGKASASIGVQSAGSADNPSGQADLGTVYHNSREQIAQALQNYPVLIRTAKFASDFKTHPYSEIPGLLIMGALVSLGAPFWNDILKSMMGLNNSLNSNQGKS